MKHLIVSLLVPIVRQSLDRRFPAQWIGRGRPIPWPARSPDITPLDFFFGGFVKDRVFQEPVRDIEELKRKVVEVAGTVDQSMLSTVDQSMLTKTWRELHRRLEFLQENKGMHCELFKK